MSCFIQQSKIQKVHMYKIQRKDLTFPFKKLKLKIVVEINLSC